MDSIITLWKKQQFLLRSALKACLSITKSWLKSHLVMKRVMNRNVNQLVTLLEKCFYDEWWEIIKPI